MSQNTICVDIAWGEVRETQKTRLVEHEMKDLASMGLISFQFTSRFPPSIQPLQEIRKHPPFEGVIKTRSAVVR
jgi:hypothetical protein